MTEATGQQPRKQHTVPASYLVAFARGEKITVVDRSSLFKRQQVAGRVTIQRDFYAPRELRQVSVNDAYFLEKQMSKVEGESKSVLDRVRRGTWPLVPADRDVLCAFAALQNLRTEARRGQLVKELSTRIITPGSRLSLGARKKASIANRPDGRDQWRVWKYGPETLVATDSWMHVRHIQDIFPAAWASISAAKLTLYRFSEPCLWTSDNPVVGRGWTRRAWWGEAIEVEVSMPVGRDMLLVGRLDPGLSEEEEMATAAGERDGEADGDRQLAEATNGLLWAHSTRSMFMHPDDEITASLNPDLGNTTWAVTNAESRLALGRGVWQRLAG